MTFSVSISLRECVRALKTNTPIKSASLPPHSFIQSMGVEKKGFVKRRLQGWGLSWGWGWNWLMNMG